MGGGPDNNTNVYEFTGMADEQYGNLRTGQKDMNSQLLQNARDQAQGFVGADRRFDQTQNQIGNLADRQQSGFATTNQNLNKVSNQVGSGFDSMGNKLDFGFAGVNDNLSDLGQGVSDVSGQVGDLGQNVDQNFSNTNDLIAGGMGQLGSGMMQGFDATGQALQNAQTSRDQYYADLKGLMNTGFQDAASQLTGVQSGLVQGQQTLGQGIADNRDKLDTSYTALTEGQQGISDQVGNVQGTMDDFRGQYDEDTTLANRARNDLSNQITGGFGETQNQAAQIANSQDAAQQRLASGLMGGGQGQLTPEQQAQQRNAKLSTVRNILTNAGNSLDPQIRQSLSTVASSFDQQGMLVPSSVSPDGSTIIRRSMDNAGNLLTRNFDQGGNLLNQNAINVDRVMTQAELIRQQMYAPENTGELSQPTQALGFVSPYMMTG